MQTFRYAACGGMNTLLGLAVYFISYKFILAGKNFDVGFFDLIIADESHRSIYNRYQDLFLYFDALQILFMLVVSY